MSLRESPGSLCESPENNPVDTKFDNLSKLLNKVLNSDYVENTVCDLLELLRKSYDTNGYTTTAISGYFTVRYSDSKIIEYFRTAEYNIIEYIKEDPCMDFMRVYEKIKEQLLNGFSLAESKLNAN